QTENVPMMAEDIKEQTENVPPVQESIAIEPVEDNTRQTENVPTIAGDNKEQTENIPPYDTSKYMLGELCVQGRNHHSTGSSLRRMSGNECLACHRDRARGYRQRKKQQATV